MSAKKTLDYSSLTRGTLESSDSEWFKEEFIRSFMHVYNNKTFFVVEDGKDVLLDMDSKEQKEKWLTETVDEEFENYVLHQKEGYKNIVGRLDTLPIAVVLYRELKDERTVYLAQGFVRTEYQRSGVAVKFISQLLNELSQNFDRFEVLTRHQNDAALRLYHRCGFSLGNNSIVEKYGYSSMKYISFYKQINSVTIDQPIKNMEHAIVKAEDSKVVDEPKHRIKSANKTKDDVTKWNNDQVKVWLTNLKLENMLKVFPNCTGITLKSLFEFKQKDISKLNDEINKQISKHKVDIDFVEVLNFCEYLQTLFTT